MVTNNNELLGQALGNCTLRRLIGRGGMGAVYLAQQTRPRRTVAVKVLMPSTFLDQKPRADFLMRFRREADAVAALDHINIMPIYEYGEQGDLAYLVMPYVTGGTLRQLLEKRGKLSLDEAVPIIEQAAAGLDAAHAQGIIHRDLKPGNILFHADGRVLLADFGLAKMVKDAQEEFDSNGQTALTSAGTIIGTPEYLSPEQGTGKLVDPRTDIYSLGIVLFQMLGGQVPFSGASPVAVAIKHALEEPPSLTEMNPAIPASVEAVVRKAMAKNPDDRYNSAGELAHALREAADLATERDSKKSNYSAYDTVIEQPGSMKLPDVDPAPAEAQQSEDTKGPGFNAALTEAVPPVSVPKKPEQPPSVPLANAETIVETPQDKQARKDEPAMQPVRLAQQQAVQSEQAANAFREEANARRKGGLPVPMMLLGGLLVLLLIVGGSVAYLNFGRSTKQQTPDITHTSTPVAKSTPHTQLTPGAVQPPSKVQAGQLLYGTSFPMVGKGPQGETWAGTPGANITYSASGTNLNNSGQNQIAGIFLKTMKNGQPIPDAYVLQVQATAQKGSNGDFGVFFLAQPDQPLNANSFMINPNGSWHTDYYNITKQKTYYQGTLIQGPFTGTVTIDIVVTGGSGTLYFNGQQQGSSGGAPSGLVGLVADAGANVTFNNVAIYA